MSFVRSIYRDLIDKRLWPAALLMLVALIAIPLLGSSASSSGADDQSMPVAPKSTTDAANAVQLLGPPSVRKRPGKLVDPFRRPPKPAPPASSAPASTAASAATSSAATSSAATSSAATPGTSAGSSTTGATNSPPGSGSTVDKAGPSAFDLSKVADVRFGKRGSTLKRIRNLAPLSSLPSEKDGIVLFAGALKKRDVARFFITAKSGKTAGGGECRIKDDRCVSLDMQIGDQQIFRVKGIEYELDLVSINSVRSSGSSASSRTKVRFGRVGAREHSIARLKALGSGTDAALLYLGTYRDTKRALFVLGPQVTATSDGDCMDGPACRILGLRDTAGGSVRLTGADGSVRSYSIYISSVARHTSSTDVDHHGRAVLRQMIRDRITATALAGFRYAPRRGVIVRTPGT